MNVIKSWILACCFGCCSSLVFSQQDLVMPLLKVTNSAVRTVFAEPISLYGGSAAGLTVDQKGNLYVAENRSGSLGVVKINPEGVRTSCVPAGILAGVTALAVDVAGNLYVADGNGNGNPGTGSNNKIWRVLTNGVVESFVSGVRNPSGLAFDSVGNLYVASFTDNAVYKYSASGVLQTNIAGGFDGLPYGLAVDREDNLYVAAFASIVNSNFNGRTIYRISKSGAVSPFFTEEFSGPHSLVFDQCGNLWASLYNGLKLVKIAPDGTATVFPGGWTADDYPNGMAIDKSGSLFVAVNGGFTTTNAAVLKILDATPTTGVFSVTSSGPLQGGAMVTIYGAGLGNGSDITNVTLSGVSASIISQNVDQVTVISGAAVFATNGAIMVYSISGGAVTACNKYTYNPAGQIGGHAIEDWTRWGEVAGLPQPRDRLAAGTLDGAIYAIGGQDNHVDKTNVFKFNGIHWTEVAGLPGYRQSHSVGTLNNALYVIGGASSGHSAYTNVFKFDGTNWSEVAGLPAKRTFAAAGALNGSLYELGGGDGTLTSRTNVFRFNGTNWVEVAGAVRRANHAVGVMNGYLYAVAGCLNGVTQHTNVYRFDGTNWMEVAGIPAPREGLSAGVLNGALYVFGGYLNNVQQTNTYRYNGTNWTEVAGLPEPRGLMGSAVLNGAIYAIGGGSDVSGTTAKTNVYRYPALSSGTGVSPSSGLMAGGTTVTIKGSNLGNGSDITSVTLCGIPASIVSQSATQVVVTSGASGLPTNGTVVVNSVSYGFTTRSNAYTYLPPTVVTAGDYLVVDLSGGTNVSAYPIAYYDSIEQLPGGTNSDAYKTTNLLMRLIPGGTFTMGSPVSELGRLEGEDQHQVTLTKPYYIGVFEVTQRQWERVMGTWPSWFTNEACRDTRPVEWVNYHAIRGSIEGAGWPANNNVDVTSFMGQLRARTGKIFDLPTEAQWEYACRAGTQSALNSGKELTVIGPCTNLSEVSRNFRNGGSSSEQNGDTTIGSAKVGSYLPNQWGLYDFHGNVWEWCLDWAGAYSGNVIDPKGAATGSGHITRGGSFGDDFRCRSANRSSCVPSYARYHVGFRISLPAIAVEGESVLPASGPLAGGNIITITGVGFGNGDITNVTVCGVVATIQSQTSNSVTVVLGPGGAGTGSVVVQSVSRGTTQLSGAYTYNPAGQIHSDILCWRSVASLPVARGLMGAAAVDGRIYAMGGYNYSWNSSAYSWAPGVATQGWTNATALPVGRAGLVCVSVGGKIYSLGGLNGASIQSGVYVYDPLQAGLGWVSLSNLPMPLWRLAAAVVNDKIYVLGGVSTNGSQSAVYEYDPLEPAQGWRHFNNLPATRENLAAVTLDGKLYAIGGSNPEGFHSSAYVCDPLYPESGWTSISNLPAALYVLTAASLKGKLFAVGGFNSSQTGVSTVYMYDPNQPTQGWLSVSNLPAVKGEAPSVVVNDRIYVISGATAPVSYTPSVYEGSFTVGVNPSAGSVPGGTMVTISGSNLGNGSDITSVTLCGIPASIISQSATQVVVTSGAAGLPTNGAVVVNSISYGFTTRSDAFTYTALPNHPPVAYSSAVTTAVNNATAAELMSSDVDGDPLSFIITTPPSHGVLSGTGSLRIYTPAEDFIGEDSFRFVAEDGATNSPEAVVTIQVTHALQKMRINCSGYNKAEALTNFPLLVVLNPGTMTNGFSYRRFASAKGHDLRFTDVSENIPLNYEIEKWDTNGASFVWVQIPVLTNGSSIWAWWGDPNLADSPPACTTNGAAWDGKYKAVWHLGEDSGPALDSTANRNVSVLIPSVGRTSGSIAGGARFDGTNGEFVVNSTFGLGNTTVTLEAMAYVEVGKKGAFLKVGDNSSGFGFGIGGSYLEDAGQNYRILYEGVRWIRPAAVLTPGWHHFAMVISASGVPSAVLDGMPLGSFAGLNAIAPVNSISHIGGYLNTNLGSFQRHYNGTLDEIRISSVSRSTNWLWACWRNMASNAVFNPCGVIVQGGRDIYGVPDDWKIRHFGGTGMPGAEAMDDNDHDGMNNLREYLAGTNPTNCASRLEMSSPCPLQDGTNVIFRWSSVTGKFYSVDVGTNLMEGFPIQGASRIAATPEINTCTIRVDRAIQKFFRVRVEP